MIDRIIRDDVEHVVDGFEHDTFAEKSVLITGGAGFLGSHLCDTLVALGAAVTCLDNFSTGLLKNVDHLLPKRGFRLVKEDVSNFKENEKFEFIFHFASRASPEEYQLYPVETLLANSRGSHNMLELARQHDSTILFASSSEVYGDPQVVPTPESYLGNINHLGARSCYVEGKRFSESLFMAFHRKYGLDMRIVRIFNTFGPRLRGDGFYARVLSRFILQALAGKRLTVYGDGSQTRSFCYITDLILGVLLVSSNVKARGEVLNLGSSQEIPILDAAKQVVTIVGSNPGLSFHPLPEDDPMRRCPDTGKAKEILEWEPQVSLENGLERTISWFRKQADGAS
ncbi:MAG: NAD-dependent epimerase/dehydratase family protein [Candidatus Bathyarchaeota archaeon]|nr:MAG: NAD-dependent epimerase/dehydratase family protein [Candidatus Bathyarchaeota archaeon]